MAHQRTLSRASDIADVLEEEEEKPVRCLKFRQQELWSWKPVWSPRVVTLMYGLVTLIFIPLGIVVLTSSSRLMTTPYLRYDSIPGCNIGKVAPKNAKVCVVSVDIPRATSKKVFFYYGIVNFFQNARSYVHSRSARQLRGDGSESLTDLETICQPIWKTNDSKPIVPCGLTAASPFNDTFKLCADPRCKTEVPISRSGIAWAVDRNFRFTGGFGDAKANALIRSEPFMVWMRIAAYRNWEKLYGRVTQKLEKRRYYVRIEASFPVESFRGEKFFHIVETTWFGGPNKFLGIAYIAVGCLSLVLAVVYGVRSKFSPEPPVPQETTVRLLDASNKDPPNASQAAHVQ